MTETSGAVPGGQEGLQNRNRRHCYMSTLGGGETDCPGRKREGQKPVALSRVGGKISPRRVGAALAEAVVLPRPRLPFRLSLGAALWLFTLCLPPLHAVGCTVAYLEGFRYQKVEMRPVL